MTDAEKTHLWADWNVLVAMPADEMATACGLVVRLDRSRWPNIVNDVGYGVDCVACLQTPTAHAQMAGP